MVMCRVDLAPPPCMHLDRLDLSTTRCLRCVMRVTSSNEDVELLPLLLSASGGLPGTFVEIGANVDGQQSRLLEECFGWRGVLIEGHPGNFKQLDSTQRRCGTHKVHSAVCPLGQKEITMLAVISRCRGSPDECRPRVPCRPLPSIMSDAGFPRANYLVLDVEGAEEIVLKTMKWNSSGELPFEVLLVEAERHTQKKNERVRAMLRSVGLKQLQFAPSPGSFNDLWVHPRIEDSRSSVGRAALRDESVWMKSVLSRWPQTSVHTLWWMNRTGSAVLFTRQVMAAMPAALAMFKQSPASSLSTQKPGHMQRKGGSISQDNNLTSSRLAPEIF
jgi:FkbM family methyltransferase